MRARFTSVTHLRDGDRSADGVLLVAWARPPIATTGRLGLAVVLSVAVSAHLTYWLGIGFGYGRLTVFAATALLALPAVALLAGPRGGEPLPAALRAVRRGGRGPRAAVARGGVSAGGVGGAPAAGVW
jgi:hypothetical protein